MDGVYGPASPPFLEIEQGAVNDAPVLLISTEIQNGSTPTDAAERADLVLSQLRSRLATLTQQRRAVWKADLAAGYAASQRLQQQRITLERRLKLLDGDMEDVNQMTGLADSSPESVREVSQTLEAQSQATEVDIGGKVARQAALADAIAKLSNQVDAKLNADPIAQQLQEVVDARQKEMDYAKQQHSVGMATESDVDHAVAALADAKAAVLERKEAAAHVAGGDLLLSLNGELLSLSVDLAELHARMTVLKNRLIVLR